MVGSHPSIIKLGWLTRLGFVDQGSREDGIFLMWLTLTMPSLASGGGSLSQENGGVVRLSFVKITTREPHAGTCFRNNVVKDHFFGMESFKHYLLSG